MKKLRSNSGYTLAPVMVIMVLVLALTGGAIANSVLNLQAQENAVKQMQGKYEAAGEIERIYTRLKGIQYTETTTTGEQLNLENVISSQVETFEPGANITVGDNNLFTVIVNKTEGGATVNAVFEVCYEYKVDNFPAEGNFTHTITITSVTYKSFDVSYGGTGGGES